MTVSSPVGRAGGMRGQGKQSRPGLPLISIITTVRNDCTEVERAIEEVRSQTYANKEHIIIDGGSEDGTVEILQRREADIDYWLSEADRGIYDAMNKGIDAAGGEWLYFFGADDSFSRPDILEAIILGNDIPAGTSLVLGNVLYPDGRLFRSRFDRRLYFKNSIHHQGVLYRRSVFEQFRYGQSRSPGGGRNFLISGDYQLNLRLFRQGKAHLYLDEVIARCGRGVSMEGRLVGYIEEIVIRHQQMNFFSAIFFDMMTLLRYGWKLTGHRR